MKIHFILLILITLVLRVNAQDAKQQLGQTNTFDTTKQANIKADSIVGVKKDSIVVKKHHDPHKATRRSAIIPGWGQAYNKEYWKIPIVYAAIGIPTYTFLYNNEWYKKTRDAYSIVVNKEYDRYDEIDPALINKETGLPIDANALQNYRNEFRRNRDYSIIFFMIAWGLNVVDATVFAHLKEFDISEDLSMRVKPAYDFNTKAPGLTFAFNFKNPVPKQWIVK
ncbi:DUF5683 domain-containing protein [Danxiaibacter flavus]|uniref:DUF5683 domain-containing protein n=1 Tax=Danxiaibacter flavus TaxID=3049108 RepID=A0ABV3Z9W6_9BACT|nr:DUF5683 domain-containing protein [Chitinophagaceae bacterium DXS]